MANAVAFALFVSSIPGRLASRPGSPHSYLGATVPGQEGGEITWQPDVVVAVPEPEYLRYSREWDQLVRLGDVKKRTAEEFAAYNKALEQAEAAREKAAAEEAAKAAKQKLPEPTLAPPGETPSEGSSKGSK